MTDYSKLSREQLIERIELLQSGTQEVKTSIEPLIHELQVHQIELEMQNRELREMQQLLEESRDRYADLYDFAPVGYLTLDEHGRVLEANLTAAALLGRERTNIVGKPFVSLLAPGEVEGFFSHLRQVFRSLTNAATELKIRTNGEIRHVRMESAATGNSAEPPRSCRTVMIDITEQKQIAETLHQSRSKKEALLDMIPAAVFFKDQELRYTDVNQFCADALHLSVEAMLGKTTFDLFPQEIAETLQRSDRAVLQAGKAILNEEQRIVDAQGNPLWISTSKAPYFDPDGKVAGLAGISMDITPIREAERRTSEVLRENRRLTRRLYAVQEKERRHLARELHDELGQWLTAIQADAQSLHFTSMSCMASMGNKERCISSSQSILDSASQIHQVVRRILRRLRPSTLDQLGLADSLRELVNQWRPHHPEIDCELTLDGSFEGLNEETNITLYRTVQEALTNVSSHAGASRVSISLHREPDSILLSVEDDGRGMDPHRPGQGLGLLGMRERIIAAEGELTVHSVPDQGTRIEVMLPFNLLEDTNEDLKPEDREIN